MIRAAPAPAPLVTEELPGAMLRAMGEMLMPSRRALPPVFLGTALIEIFLFCFDFSDRKKA